MGGWVGGLRCFLLSGLEGQRRRDQSNVCVGGGACLPAARAVRKPVLAGRNYKPAPRVLALVLPPLWPPGNLCAHAECAEALAQLGLDAALAEVVLERGRDETVLRYVARIRQKQAARR